MAIQLLAIKFNHDSNSATGDALNIRRNATQFVNVPEWQRGVSVNPEDSPAAYSIGDTQGNTITIQAKFRSTGEVVNTAEIRAVDPAVDPPQPNGCAAFLLWLLRGILRAMFGNVLGEVKATQVIFSAGGETNFVTFQLEHLRLWNAGVGVRTTTWRWQYRLQPGDPWTDFDTSTHRIYSVLKVPTLPWKQTPYNSGNTQLPWTEVMDYSCGWAFLKTNAADAAERVTRNVYNLGPSVIEYDCPGGGSTNYAWPSFNCTAFLERLRGGLGLGQYVNCTDCATITSTFANVLGCDLWQSQMGWGFGLNPILGIGSSAWQPACTIDYPDIWGTTGGFSYHEVAWEGACGADDHIWDACLEVDGDADPTAAPHTALLPADMRFGNTGDGDYRDRLVPPATRPNCNPHPETKQRRAVI
ncbi:MAG TPA: hypothetical protein VNZ44_11505 [Pyrinomonadaceae bacterium]|nr:hypothetical protein [Pyrinomonadaceae bacterium]